VSSPYASVEDVIANQDERPEFLPGKRALAIGLCVYHSILSTILFQAPRFIPFTLGPFFEALVTVFAPLRPALILRLVF
jgi:hypothetical protein